MKKIGILLLIIVAISCNTKIEKQAAKTVVVETEEHNENEVHLTKTQLETAKVVVDKIAKKNIRERIKVTGTIEVPPQSKATVYAPLEAFVYETDLLPGDKVKKGQIVAVLQHPNFIKLQHSFVESINNRNVAKANYERKKMLLAKDITSKKSFERAEGAYRSSKSLVNSYTAQLKMVGVLPDKIISDGIQQFVNIVAPIEGYVVENNLNKGKFLAANEEMMEIIDTDHMHAELNVFGTDISKIKKGNEFLFQPSGIETSYEGYIKLISQKVNSKTKTVNVHGHFEDESQQLKAGMFINAQVLIGEKNVFAVPEEAIIEIDGESFIFKAESDVEFVPVEVTLGNTDNGFVEVKTIVGDDFGINIITKGAHYLKGVLIQKAGGMEGHAH